MTQNFRLRGKRAPITGAFGGLRVYDPRVLASKRESDDISGWSRRVGLEAGRAAERKRIRRGLPSSHSPKPHHRSRLLRCFQHVPGRGNSARRPGAVGSW